MIIRMIIILLRFDGGSTEEEHDIAHIASSISCPHSVAGFFSSCFKRLLRWLRSSTLVTYLCMFPGMSSLAALLPLETVRKKHCAVR